MLAALLIVGTILAIPMLYFCACWSWLSYKEQREIRQLVLAASILPADPRRFTGAQAIQAEAILKTAYLLPCVLPDEIPPLKELWLSRREIHQQAREEADRDS